VDGDRVRCVSGKCHNHNSCFGILNLFLDEWDGAFGTPSLRIVVQLWCTAPVGLREGLAHQSEAPPSSVSILAATLLAENWRTPCRDAREVAREGYLPILFDNLDTNTGRLTFWKALSEPSQLQSSG
jgi:hypothetical protein